MFSDHLEGNAHAMGTPLADGKVCRRDSAVTRLPIIWRGLLQDKRRKML